MKIASLLMVLVAALLVTAPGYAVVFDTITDFSGGTHSGTATSTQEYGQPDTSLRLSFP